MTDKTTGFNTWGGTGAGSNVGFWDKNADGDKLVFTTDDYNAGTTAIIGVPTTDNLAYTPAVYNLSGMRLDQLHPRISPINTNLQKGRVAAYILYPHPLFIYSLLFLPSLLYFYLLIFYLLHRLQSKKKGCAKLL